MSEARFYKWRRRPAEPKDREVRRARLEERITHFFRRSGDTCGSPRITLDLWAEGWKVSVNTVSEIMAELGVQGRKPPRRRRSLTRRGKRRAARDRDARGDRCSVRPHSRRRNLLRPPTVASPEPRDAGAVRPGLQRQ
ncbi:IS3 family transposase [Kitasatospora sp. NPDC056138]|uniref:IS3 family transposase n=1 Tax=Kitasatospora sp. NPDC056138 TaxID=3345724 RepID=UPI0035DCA26F